MNTTNEMRAIAISLIAVQTFGGIVEIMNRIAVDIDGYSELVCNYFKGLHEYIDGNGNTFKPITDYYKRRCENMGARLLLNPHPGKAVDVIVRLHHMLEWVEGESAMIALTDRLYDIAEEKYGVPSFIED